MLPNLHKIIVKAFLTGFLFGCFSTYAKAEIVNKFLIIPVHFINTRSISDSDSAQKKRSKIPVIIKDSTLKLTDTSINKGVQDTATTEKNKKKNNQLNSKIDYTAKDSIRFNVEQQMVYLYGSAEIHYEDINLKAERIDINWNTHIVHAYGVADSSGHIKGTPVFKEKAQEYRAGEMTYNFESKKGRLSNIITHEGQGYLHGEAVKKDQDNNFYVRSGAYTTCDLDTPHFYISATKLKVIQNNKIVTGPAYLVIENIPTPLAIPFGFFPNKRGQSSGILIPAIGQSNYGFGLENGGYYFGLGEYANLTLRGDIYTKGTYALRARSDYNRRYHYNGNLGVDFTSLRSGELHTPEYSESNSFFIRWNHNQDPKSNPTSTFRASVNAGSSKHFKNTLNVSPTDYLSSNFNSSIGYSKTWPSSPFNLGITLRQSQNNLELNSKTPNISLVLPEINFNMNRITPFARKEAVGLPRWYEKVGLTYSNQMQNLIRAFDSTLFKKQTFNNMQSGIRHTASLNTSFKLFKYFNATPTINYNERWYTKTIDTKPGSRPGTILQDTAKGFATERDYNFNINATTKLYGIMQFGKKSRLQAIRHVITPSVGITLMPDFSENSYGYYQTVPDSFGINRKYSRFGNGLGFLGDAPIGKQAAMNFGFDNNLEIKVKSATDTGIVVKKVKLIEGLSFGSSYNFAADSLKLRPISISGRTTLFDKVGILFNSTLDPYATDIRGNEINKYLVNTKGSLGRIRNSSLSLNYSLISGSNTSKTNASKDKSKVSQDEMEYIRTHPEEYIDFNIPLSLNISYSLGYNNSLDYTSATRVNVTQAVTLTGNFNLTPKWKVEFSSGYDFKAKDVTFTRLYIIRDLHCWEMKMTWVPFGPHQSYNFQINVKSSVLQDLKLSKKSQPGAF